jgi:CRP-like cAMP-binding protein
MRASVRQQPGLCSPWLRSDAVAETLTLIEKTVHLKSSEVFHAIPTEPLAQLAARASELQLDSGQALFREGDDEQGVFIVIEGVIELRKGETVVRVLRSGTVHGELFLQESGSHQYTAIAREDARVLNLGRSDVFDALLEYPEFGVAMVQDLASRHHKLTERVMELEQQITPSPAVRSGEPADTEGIEPPAPAPSLPRRRGWWRLAARFGAKPPVADR